MRVTTRSNKTCLQSILYLNRIWQKAEGNTFYFQHIYLWIIKSEQKLQINISKYKNRGGGRKKKNNWYYTIHRKMANQIEFSMSFLSYKFFISSPPPKKKSRHSLLTIEFKILTVCIKVICYLFDLYEISLPSTLRNIQIHTCRRWRFSLARWL